MFQGLARVLVLGGLPLIAAGCAGSGAEPSVGPVIKRETGATQARIEEKSKSEARKRLKLKFDPTYANCTVFNGYTLCKVWRNSNTCTPVAEVRWNGDVAEVKALAEHCQNDLSLQSEDGPAAPE